MAHTRESVYTSLEGGKEVVKRKGKEKRKKSSDYLRNNNNQGSHDDENHSVLCCAALDVSYSPLFIVLTDQKTYLIFSSCLFVNIFLCLRRSDVIQH